MSRRSRGYQEVRIADPRDADATLVVALDVAAHAVEPHGYGADFDPGSAAELTVVAVYDELSDLVRLPAAYDDAVEAAARAALEAG